MSAAVKARCSAGLNNILAGYKWEMGPKYQWNRASSLLSIVCLLVGRVGLSIYGAGKHRTALMRRENIGLYYIFGPDTTAAS